MFMSKPFAIEMHFIFHKRSIECTHCTMYIACDTIFLFNASIIIISFSIFLMAHTLWWLRLHFERMNAHAHKEKSSTHSKSNGNTLINEEIVQISQRLLLVFGQCFPTMTSSSYIYTQQCECLMFLITQIKSAVFTFSQYIHIHIVQHVILILFYLLLLFLK